MVWTYCLSSLVSPFPRGKGEVYALVSVWATVIFGISAGMDCGALMWCGRRPTQMRRWVGGGTAWRGCSRALQTPLQQGLSSSSGRTRPQDLYCGPIRSSSAGIRRSALSCQRNSICCMFSGTTSCCVTFPASLVQLACHTSACFLHV